jgi:hypothetical protein
MHRPTTQSAAGSGALDPDRLAVERYRYLLRTAPPEELERAHEEAFASLTPEQRRMALETLQREVEPAESRGATDDPADLARLATRTELRRPGTIERAFGGAAGAGGGGFAFGGFLPTLAGAFMGTAIASMLFGSLGGFGAADAAAFEGDGSDAGGGNGSGDAGAVGEGSADAGAGGGDPGGRGFGGEWGDGGNAGDLGGDGGELGDAGGYGDLGDGGGFGDLGGFGDFGGGDFGGF